MTHAHPADGELHTDTTAMAAIEADSPRPPARWRMVVYSLIGIVMFFVPVTINGASSIPLDHLVTWVRGLLGPADRYVALALIAAGAVFPFATGRWRQSVTTTVFAFLGVVGLLTACMVVFGFGPSWVLDKGIGPFLLDKLVIPVGLIVPIGGVFLALVIGYGLMEFVGVYLRPAMRPIWRVPGRAAVDAVASFVGSYALGLLLTNRMYTGGRYTAREAAIIAVGFSTVSATFMVIVAKTLDLMDHWLWYFFGTLVVTFVVTAITVRIPPLSRIPDEPFPGAVHVPEEAVTQDRFRVARRAAEQTLAEAPSLGRNVWLNFRDGLVMVLQILPSIMSVGLIALVLATYTPVFEWVGLIFQPVFWALGFSDPALMASASATSIAEMFIPATMLAGHEDFVARFVIGVVCVSAIIFFSALVPAILATDIPVKLWHLVVIWVERVVLTVLLATPLGHLVAALTS
ncbi:YjiH family protein [Micrococcus porci]|uniref:YjiH family protein n=1 Tax=Micrococcus TaxID=1269 RepID=UPI001CCB152F|nr:MULTISPECIES: YjiH family protein [Micrococcus]MCG7422711.1 YjiH family protein [Micrococcus sp. ACRRV]UBH24776.1 YjiH family protein [Micrococcus porci]